MRSGARRRMPRLAALGATLLLLAACAPTPAGPDEWALAPIPFATALTGKPGDAHFGDTPLADARTTDLAFGMSVLSADGDGGFWAESAGSWLHVGEDGQTLARFNTEPEDPLSHIVAMAPMTKTELVVSRDDGHPVLSVLDTTSMTLRDVTGGPDDFAFGDVAVHEGAAFVVRYQPREDAYVDYELLRIGLDDRVRTVLHSGPLSPADAPSAAPGLPPVEVDVDAAGRLYLATPGARIVLDPDGSERRSEPQRADFPHVAVRPDGTALWWGGGPRASEERGVILGGSSEARASIERRADCRAENLRTDALTLSDRDGDEHPLPFLCGANAAVWSGASWVVAIGGEGDGVLVRVSPPESLDGPADAR